MIDNASNIWLIEINTNPCIEESSPLLQKLIPRMLSIQQSFMLDDAFRLTIDKIFPP
jgi:tubulin--tyrosine ligase/tubulin polyglutamylase TTLL9